MSELKIGDKIRVIIPSSVFYGEVVELVEITKTRYYFTNENHPRGTFSILKNEQSGFKQVGVEA